MIDNGARLNIVSFHVVQQLGLSEFSIDTRRKITIKAYDKVERSSKGLIILPIWVGPIEKDIVFQVLDIPLAYNLLLGHPWIHDMQVVPSTYHQCIKFPYNETEVVIPRDNAISINTLTMTETFIPHNKPAHDLHASLVATEQKLKMMSIGMGEYTLDSIAAMPISPKSYGKPAGKMKSFELAMTIFDTFVQSFMPLEAKKEEKIVKDWIYRGEEDDISMVTTPISPRHYGKGYTLLQQMGY